MDNKPNDNINYCNPSIKVVLQSTCIVLYGQWHLENHFLFHILEFKALSLYLLWDSANKICDWILKFYCTVLTKIGIICFRNLNYILFIFNLCRFSLEYLNLLLEFQNYLKINCRPIRKNLIMFFQIKFAKKMIGYLSESESEYRLRKIGRKLKSFYISRTDWQFEAKSFWCNRKVFLKSRT